MPKKQKSKKKSVQSEDKNDILVSKSKNSKLVSKNVIVSDDESDPSSSSTLSVAKKQKKKPEESTVSKFVPTLSMHFFIPFKKKKKDSFRYPQKKHQKSHFLLINP